MAKIIEFNGLPGCGKTTLCDEIIRQSPEKKISYINSVSYEIKKIPFFLRVVNFPYKACLMVLCMYFTTPLLPIREIRIYKNTLMFVIKYRFAQLMNQYDFLLEDHGLIQCIVSFFYRREKLFKPFHSRLIKRLYMEIGPSTIFFCDISVQTALKRMNIRNRNAGRIDRIKDDSEKLSALNNQKFFFAEIINKLDLSGDAELICLNMENSIESIYRELLAKIY